MRWCWVQGNIFRYLILPDGILGYLIQNHCRYVHKSWVGERGEASVAGSSPLLEEGEVNVMCHEREQTAKFLFSPTHTLYRLFKRSCF